MRLSKIAKELNISITRLAEFLDSKGHSIDVRPTTKISQVQYDILLQEFNKDFFEKQQSSEAIELKKQEKEIDVEKRDGIVSRVKEEKEEEKEEVKEEDSISSTGGHWIRALARTFLSCTA